MTDKINPGGGAASDGAPRPSIGKPENRGGQGGASGTTPPPQTKKP